jgi:trehalose synthase
VREVLLPAVSPRMLEGIVPPVRLDALIDRLAVELRTSVSGRCIINVNSAEVGGGVAEMLRVLLPYTRGAGLDARWFVIEGDPEFFRITKRLHHRLHGRVGDGGPLGPAEAAKLVEIAEANTNDLRANVVPGDVIVVHDPQPAALLPLVSEWGLHAIWRCHIGTDVANEWSVAAWEFLRPFLEGNVAAYVFSREAYAPDWIPRDLLRVIPPAIDPVSPKNQDMEPTVVLDALRHVGIVGGDAPDVVPFVRSDGAPGRILHYADVIRTGPPPDADAQLVVQVSRWDPLKDMRGVMHSFVDQVLDNSDAHLVLAGPVVTSVADDPEASEILDAVWREWSALPHAARSRVQLVCLPMVDSEENAAIVNALQRHATVVVQKSLEEGFGLTVTEALYKGRAVLASAVGGINDQITDRVNGLLLKDPTDLATCGALVSELLVDPNLRAALGARAKQTVIDQFLPDSSLTRWGEVVLFAVGGGSPGGASVHDA